MIVMMVADVSGFSKLSVHGYAGTVLQDEMWDGCSSTMFCVGLLQLAEEDDKVLF